MVIFVMDPVNFLFFVRTISINIEPIRCKTCAQIIMSTRQDNLISNLLAKQQVNVATCMHIDFSERRP